MNERAEFYPFLETVRTGGRGGTTARVAAALREAIASLELKPGEAIDKTALCRRLGVSRFPVSEALGLLQGEGLVDIQPQRGTTVALIRLSNARENMFLRRALESEAMQALAGSLSKATLGRLDSNLRYQRAAVRAEDGSGFHSLDLEFHDILLGDLGFPRVKAAVDTARLALDRVRRLLASPRRHQVTLEEHERIVAALQARDGQAAARAMEAHLDAVMIELMALARMDPGIFADRDEWAIAQLVEGS